MSPGTPVRSGGLHRSLQRALKGERLGVSDPAEVAAALTWDGTDALETMVIHRMVTGAGEEASDTPAATSTYLRNMQSLFASEL